MTRRKAPAAPTRLHAVDERVVDTPDGPVLRVHSHRGRPEVDRRDPNLSVWAYRAVVGTTDATEVLSPCGHEVPRFDLTPAFQELVRHDGPQYPRSRLCPHCHQSPLRAALARVARPGNEATDLQLASDWGGLTKRERDVARPLLELLRRQVRDLPDVAEWSVLSPQERRQLALAGEAFALRLGLTFREVLSLKPTPAAAITAAGLRRLQASPVEKERRAQRRDDAAYRRDLERQRR